VRHELLGEVEADLHFPDARLGLGVDDAKARAGGVVHPQITQPHIAQLAGA
jgi:hypothetical protein